jgi:ribosomal protein S6E (S10)
MALKYNQTRVALDGTQEVIALVGGVNPFLIIVEPLGGASADVEFSASDDFTGATKQVEVDQDVATAVFDMSTSTIDVGPQTLEDLGLTASGETFEIQGTVSNNGFYRVIEIQTATKMEVLLIGGAVANETPTDFTLLSGPTGGESAIWVPWDAGTVTAITSDVLPGSPCAVRVTASGGDVIAEISGAE